MSSINDAAFLCKHVLTKHVRTLTQCIRDVSSVCDRTRAFCYDTACNLLACVFSALSQPLRLKLPSCSSNVSRRTTSLVSAEAAMKERWLKASGICLMQTFFDFNGKIIIINSVNSS